MVWSHNLWPDYIVNYVFQKTFWNYEVIETPAYIFCATVLHVGPVSVWFLKIRIKVTESIDKSQSEQFCKSCSFFWSKTGTFMIAFWIGEV